MKAIGRPVAMAESTPNGQAFSVKRDAASHAGRDAYDRRTATMVIWLSSTR